MRVEATSSSANPVGPTFHPFVRERGKEHGQLPLRAHFTIMTNIVTILVILAMLGTVGALFAGLFSMVRGGTPGRANKLMQYRVLLQGAAIALFVVLLTLLKH